MLQTLWLSSRSTSRRNLWWRMGKWNTTGYVCSLEELVWDAYGVDPYGKKPVAAEVFSPTTCDPFWDAARFDYGCGTRLDKHRWGWESMGFQQRGDETESNGAHWWASTGADHWVPTLWTVQYSARFETRKDRSCLVQSKLDEGRRRLEFCTQLYEQQMQRGKLFLHDHPNTARSRREPCIQRVCEMPFVQRITGDMCRQGMVGQDEHGVALVKKPSGYITNFKMYSAGIVFAVWESAWRVCRRLDLNARRAVTVRKGGPRWEQVVRRFTMAVDNHVVLQDLRDAQNASQQDLFFTLPATTRNIETILYEKAENIKWHRHVQLINGRAKRRKCILRDWFAVFWKAFAERWRRRFFWAVWLLDWWMRKRAWVLVCLNRRIGRRSWMRSRASRWTLRWCRAEEIELARRYNVMCGHWPRLLRHGSGLESPVGCRWIDIDKGDAERPNYRSCLVIQEVRTSGIEAIFAATPPLESIRFSLCLQRSGKKKQNIMFVDIRRAHWTAKIGGLVCIETWILREVESCNVWLQSCSKAVRDWDYGFLHGTWLHTLALEALFYLPIRRVT